MNDLHVEVGISGFYRVIIKEISAILPWFWANKEQMYKSHEGIVP